MRDTNPWWMYEEWDYRDKNLTDYNSAKIKWIPNWINLISLEPFSLNFIIGPRQVGKTTGIKRQLLIKRLIKENIDPKALVYIDCEAFPDFILFLYRLRLYLTVYFF